MLTRARSCLRLLSKKLCRTVPQGYWQLLLSVGLVAASWTLLRLAQGSPWGTGSVANLQSPFPYHWQTPAWSHSCLHQGDFETGEQVRSTH